MEVSRLASNSLLCPKQNQDLEIIKLENQILEGIKIVEVETWEVLELALMDNDLEFQRYIGVNP